MYTSGFHGIVTMHTEIPAFLPLVIQGYMHAQACACTVDVLALLWYTLLPQYKMHSRYAAARKRNEKPWSKYFIYRSSLISGAEPTFRVWIPLCLDPLKAVCVWVLSLVFIVVSQYFSMAQWRAMTKSPTTKHSYRLYFCKLAKTYTHVSCTVPIYVPYHSSTQSVCAQVKSLRGRWHHPCIDQYAYVYR